MKKLTLILIILLALVGCKQAAIEPVSNNVLFIVNGKEIKEAQVFEAMRLSNGGYELLKIEAQKVLLKELVEEDAAFDEYVAERLEEAKALMGDNFKLFLSQNNFEDEADYVEKIIKDIARLDLATTKAMEDDYESLKKLRPRYVRVLEVKKDDGGKALELAKAGQSLEEIAVDYAVSSTTYKGQKILVSEISAMDVGPLDKLLNATETGLIEELIAGQSTTGNFILEIVDINADNAKDEAIQEFILNDKLSKEYLGKLFKENNFKIYDQELFNNFKENYPEFIK